LLVNEGRLLKVGDYPDEWGNKIFVYSNKSLGSSRVLPAEAQIEAVRKVILSPGLIPMKLSGPKSPETTLASQ
jgi:hypothetical protein